MSLSFKSVIDQVNSLDEHIHDLKKNILMLEDSELDERINMLTQESVTLQEMFKRLIRVSSTNTNYLTFWRKL